MSVFALLHTTFNRSLILTESYKARWGENIRSGSHINGNSFQWISTAMMVFELAGARRVTPWEQLQGAKEGRHIAVISEWKNTELQWKAGGLWMDSSLTITHLKALCNNVMLPEKKSYKACFQISSPHLSLQEKRVLRNCFIHVFSEYVLEADRE